MAWTVAGGVLEVVGLGVAAYGLFLTWRGVAEGHRFLPLRRPSVNRGTLSTATLRMTASAYGYAASPDDTVDEKFARVHQQIGELHRQLAVERTEREAGDAQAAEVARGVKLEVVAERNAEARADTRLAAAGLSLAVAGAILQVVGAATAG